MSLRNYFYRFGKYILTFFFVTLLMVLFGPLQAQAAITKAVTRVSACKIRKPDTRAFVPMRHKSFLCELLESCKTNINCLIQTITYNSY